MRFDYHINEETLVSLRTEGPHFVIRMRLQGCHLSPELLNCLLQALDQVEECLPGRADNGPCAVITTGWEELYATGIDHENILKNNKATTEIYKKLLLRLITFPIPTVAAINGNAFGEGLVLAMAHDYRTMCSDLGYLCMYEVDFLNPLTQAMIPIVKGKLSDEVYRECFWGIRPFPGDSALLAGLVHGIAPQTEVLDSARALANREIQISQPIRNIPRAKTWNDETYKEAILALTREIFEKSKL
ncbi:ClpP/crotonase [Basidiobolus meristosporus CBS 931.73]|uniref:ClpP/crotonase n=1 Tax=Basidiobolus meristosporus CBS 931.73 TaxID=1314790 RepID=A0A1Y1YGP7_9FUNG|nr:ClpP/crotonase [Basidiobolus meristosporus CBS 931.73]|eukprot:ORX97128.1 ClpP/crotonase [Basidiobolus meristosporus CBS 931.73]